MRQRDRHTVVAAVLASVVASGGFGFILGEQQGAQTLPAASAAAVDVTFLPGTYDAWCPTMTSLSVEPQANPYDADTFELVLASERDGQRYQWRQRLRLDHIDAPEIRGIGVTAEEKARALLARDAAEEALACGTPARERLTVEVGREDKYGRPLTTVVVTWRGGEDLASELIADGHGVPYEGGARQ